MSISRAVSLSACNFQVGLLPRRRIPEWPFSATTYAMGKIKVVFWRSEVPERLRLSDRVSWLPVGVRVGRIDGRPFPAVCAFLLPGGCVVWRFRRLLIMYRITGSVTSSMLGGCTLSDELSPGRPGNTVDGRSGSFRCLWQVSCVGEQRYRTDMGQNNTGPFKGPVSFRNDRVYSAAVSGVMRISMTLPSARILAANCLK